MTRIWHCFISRSHLHCTHSPSRWCTLARSPAHALTHTHTHSPHSLTQLCTTSFSQSVSYSFTQTLTPTHLHPHTAHMLTHSTTQSLTYAPRYSLSGQLLIHSLTRSHPLTHSPTLTHRLSHSLTPTGTHSLSYSLCSTSSTTTRNRGRELPRMRTATSCLPLLSPLPKHKASCKLTSKRVVRSSASANTTCPPFWGGGPQVLGRQLPLPAPPPPRG